jgi:hypothetical protein
MELEHETSQDLLWTMEVDATTTKAQEIAAGRVAIEDLQRHGALHFVVMVGGRLKDVVVADVHDIEMIADETNAIGARNEGVAADFERDFGEEIALVFFLDGRRVSGGIDEDGEDAMVVGEVDAGRIAELGVGGFAGVEDGVREEFGGLRCAEDGALSLRGCGERNRDKSGEDDETDRTKNAESVHCVDLLRLRSEYIARDS